MSEESRSEVWNKELEREFLAVYDAHADALFRHCLLRVRDREVAKDIVQESFSRTWDYLSQGKKIEYLRAFVFRVAGNLIVDLSRRKKSVSLDGLMEADGFEPVDENAVDPTRLPQLRETMKHLQALDEIYRTAITMRYFDNLTPKEIALKLGVSENVVSVRIHRGIQRLSYIMEQKPALES
jgi:RNA polymerase sigma-70 factor (ECF subfamily)